MIRHPILSSFPVLPLGLALALTLVTPLRADPPQVVAAQAKRASMGWDISATVRHDDTGWDHYADGWDVLDTAGNVLGHRKLHHPHVNEQPFTRSLRALIVPDGTREVFIRAYCSMTGETSELFRVRLLR